jgi:hypothetical protein
MKLVVLCLVSALLTSYAEFSILSAQSRVDRGALVERTTTP